MPQRWYDDRVAKHVDAEIIKRLEKSGFIVEGEIKMVITEKGLIDEGLYRGTITHEVDPAKLSVRVGSPIKADPRYPGSLPYPVYLEFGTSNKDGSVRIPTHAPMRTGLANSRSRLKGVW